MIPLLSSGVKIISHSPPTSPNASQLLADSEARAVTPAHLGLEERSDNGRQTVQSVTQGSIMEEKAPVMEPMPKDDSAMETPVTVLEAEAKADSVSAMETLVTVLEAEGKAESVSAMETPVTVMVPEGMAESASVTDTPVTVTEPEAKSEHLDLLKTDGPSNGIDPSQPLFSQPEHKYITERIMVEERHLQ